MGRRHVLDRAEVHVVVAIVEAIRSWRGGLLPLRHCLVFLTLRNSCRGRTVAVAVPSATAAVAAKKKCQGTLATTMPMYCAAIFVDPCGQGGRTVVRGAMA